jgi:hypothetical protein
MTDSVGQRHLHYKESDIFNCPLGSLRNREQLKTTTVKGKEINKVCLNWFFDLCTMTKHQSELGGATILEIWLSMNISLPEH